MRGTQLRTTLLALALVAGLVACGDDSSDSASSDSKSADDSSAPAAEVIAVPADQPTIQEAVDVAEPGALILVSPGTYNEEVTVETDDLTIRGLDRNDVIIDGEFARENGIKVFSNGVAVENLSVRNHTGNGVFFTGDYGKGVTLSGYRASYVTAYNNGLYGIYAFSAEDGQIDHSYGSGHPDSAFYVGQCQDCNALLTDNVAENNMLGYSGTNSTGVTIVNSVWRNNRAGIVPNSLYTEAFGPNSGSTIVGNLVEDNNSSTAPESASFAVAFGNGIVIGGGSKIIVERNTVSKHKNAGIVVTDLPTSKDPADDKEKSFKPEGNQVRENVLSQNTFDLAYLTVNYASQPFGNCFEKNSFTSSFPEGIEKSMSCGAPVDTDLGDLSGILARITAGPPAVDYKTVAAPGPQENMAKAATAKAAGAKGPASVDLASITAPKG